MGIGPAHLEALCRCLAFHCVESENTRKFMEGEAADIDEQISAARELIAESGFDFDVLYPVADRPVTCETVESI